MSEPYDSDEAQAVDLIATTLAALPVFQAMTGAASAAIARRAIVEVDGDGAPRNRAHAVLDMLGTDTTRQADGAHRGGVVVGVQVLEPPSSGLDGTSAYRRALNHYGAIRSGLSRLDVVASLRCAPPVRLVDEGDTCGWYAYTYEATLVLVS